MTIAITLGSGTGIAAQFLPNLNARMAGVTKATNFTLDGTDDVGGLAKVVCSHASTAIAMTIPPATTYSWRFGTQIPIERGGAAAATIARGSGVVLHEVVALADGSWESVSGDEYRYPLAAEPVQVRAATGSFLLQDTAPLDPLDWRWDAGGYLHTVTAAGAPSGVTIWKADADYVLPTQGSQVLIERVFWNTPDVWLVEAVV